MGSIYLAKRQSLFGNGAANVTSSNPPLSGTQTSPTSSNKETWKYIAIVIVLVVLATVAFSRLMLVRRLRARTSRQVEHGQSGAAMSSHSNSRSGVLPPYYDREEYHRRREQNREVRQALRDAGLLLIDERSPSEADRAHAERLERRARREERRRRRREVEEGAGLPAYSKEKGEGEKVLETGQKAKEDSGDSSGESDDDDEREDDIDGRSSRAQLLSSMPQPPPPARVTERRRE